MLIKLALRRKQNVIRRVGIRSVHQANKEVNEIIILNGVLTYFNFQLLKSCLDFLQKK